MNVLMQVMKKNIIAEGVAAVLLQQTNYAVDGKLFLPGTTRAVRPFKINSCRQS